MDEQEEEMYEVGVRHQIVERRWDAPGERQHQLGDVMEMARDAPVTGHQE